MLFWYDYDPWQMSDQESVPMPIVLIDQDSDSDATIVQLSFGDRLGALVDTVKSFILLPYSKGILQRLVYICLKMV